MDECFECALRDSSQPWGWRCSRASDSIHLFCSQHVFLPRLQRDLDVFRMGWDNHPLRTEQNRTPQQLWTIGLLQKPIEAPGLAEVRFQLVFPFFFCSIDCYSFGYTAWKILDVSIVTTPPCSLNVSLLFHKNRC